MTRSAIVALVVAAQALSDAHPGSVRRLDGSRIGVGEVDATVTRLMGAADVTGVGVAIFNDGKPVYEKAYGLRDVEKRLPLTPDSVMSAASLTKATFACMVMQLVEERILDLDTPIERYLTKPLVQHEGYESLARDDRYRTITARMLLSHTAGFANLRALEPGRQITIHFDPGTRYAYSGQGLQLLQLVVEEATGAPLADLMHARIFVPLRMTRTSMTWQPQFENDVANGYDAYGRSLGPQRRPRADAAGSMQTTLADVARLMQSAREGSRLRARIAAVQDPVRPEQAVLAREHELRRDLVAAGPIEDPALPHAHAEPGREVGRGLAVRRVICDKQQRSPVTHPVSDDVAFVLGEARLRDVAGAQCRDVARVGDDEHAHTAEHVRLEGVDATT